MRDISKRVRNAEKKLNLSQEHIAVDIVCYGDKLPPDRTEGNITIHYVKYDEKAKP